MVSIQNLSVEFSAKSLFDNINYVINRKDRIALVGKNGAGKSTMLKIIAGIQRPTSGCVSMPQDVTVGYLPQQMEVTDDLTVMEEVRKAFSHIGVLKEELDKANAELLERTDYDSTEYQKLIDRMTWLSERLAIEESENSEAEIEKTLIGLGFVRSDFNRPTSEFSGGWRMRIELAKILLRRPDVLLLDEPTNHLDIESIQWLEQFLISKAGAVVLVSHDKAFIDNVTNRTIEISLGKIYDYSVNYSHYLVLRKERLDQQMRAYQNQQKQIQDTEDFIERFRYKATKSVQVQSRIKQLAKIERIEVDQIDTSHLNLRFPPAPRSGDYPVIAEAVGKRYGEHQVFENATFTIKRGEKVAFVGKNGQGKSTMVKCIMGEIPYDGSLKTGHNVSIGYFAQNQASMLDGEVTVFDTIDRVATGPIRTRIRDILGAFMFGGEASDKKVKVLSGGEKTRLAMIRLLLTPVNLLILDEPTNHLDIPTKEILKQAIQDFDGTVILVSHDRDFLDGLVDKVYEFSDGKVRECLGGITEFLEKKKMQNLQQLESQPTSSAIQQKTAAKQPQAPVVTSTPEKSGTSQRMSYAEQKERDKLLRRAKAEVERAEAEITLIEKEILEVEERLSGEGYSGELMEEHSKLQKRLDNAMSTWELATMHLETLTGGK